MGMNFFREVLSKFSHRQVEPFPPEHVEKHGHGFRYNEKSYVTHSRLKNSDSAFFRSHPTQLVILILIMIGLIVGFTLDWRTSLIVVLAILTLVYFADLLFNLFLIYRSFTKDPELDVSEDELKLVDRSTLPMYTILCPLYKEALVLPQFLKSMEQLDYPHEKLQVMLLLEEDDKETIKAAQDMNLPSFFDIVVVPHSYPKTKPKACNYGLRFAKGEYVVIYDAEDIPEPDQLLKALQIFTKSPNSSKIACVQAKLNFYNPHQNLLTRVFTAEYSLWFDLVLTGMQSINAPIPLGGTSNHFPTALLKKFDGWDPFNVTEDCDLGMRLVKRGYQTVIMDSTTWEEANSSAINWFWQRTRWIKGYIQTYFVHMRRPKEFVNKWLEPHVVTFQLVVGGKVTSMIINPIMWVTTLSYIILRPVVGPFLESVYPAPVLYMGTFSLIFGNFLYMYYYMIGCVKRDQDELVKYALLVPFYWLAMSAAAWMSVVQFLYQPHYWSKTKHGLHLSDKKSKKLAHARIKTTVDNEPVKGGIDSKHLSASV